MSKLLPVSPMELRGNAIQMIAKDWALVSAAVDGKANTMTISWGGLGNLWNRPVAFIFVRDHRYTYQFTEGSSTFSVCFFSEKYREELTYCGRVSGRDEDKIAACGFTTLYDHGAPYFAEADTVLICRKVYAQDLREDCALSDVVTDQYPLKDYHRMYVGEILAAYQRSEGV